MSNKKRNYKPFFAIAKALGLNAENRKDIAYDFSEGRTTSLKELTDKEYSAVLKSLKKRQSALPSTTKGDKQRKKIIALCRDMGMEKYDTVKQKMVADMPKIYKLIVDKGYLKPKKLNDYTANELPKLVTQVQNIQLSYLEKQRNGSN